MSAPHDWHLGGKVGHPPRPINTPYGLPHEVQLTDVTLCIQNNTEINRTKGHTTNNTHGYP